MKKTKNYFVLLLFLMLFAVGCSKPEEEKLIKPVSNIEYFGEAKDFIPIQILTNDDGLQRSQSYTYFVREFLFLRPNGANNLGHVGVAFEYQIRNGNTIVHRSWYWGSVENPSGSWSIASNSNNGGFARSSSSINDMFSDMKARNYKQYKAKSARELNYNYVLNAYYQLIGFPNRGYHVLGNNCMNASWDVMWQLYTPDVAWVQNFWNFAPAVWFHRNTNGWGQTIFFN